jgi:hypothetical protein
MDPAAPRALREDAPVHVLMNNCYRDYAVQNAKDPGRDRWPPTRSATKTSWVARAGPESVPPSSRATAVPRLAKPARQTWSARGKSPAALRRHAAGRAVIRWASCLVMKSPSLHRSHPARVPHMPRWLRQRGTAGRA